MADLLKPVIVVAIGLFCISMGVRAASGFESEVTHLYGGVDETITCEGGLPVEGKGAHALTAKTKCAEEQADQRSAAPWWVLGGIAVAIYGVTQFKKARNA